jgi:hypothetical protein
MRAARFKPDGEHQQNNADFGQRSMLGVMVTQPSTAGPMSNTGRDFAHNSRLAQALENFEKILALATSGTVPNIKARRSE